MWIFAVTEPIDVSGVVDIVDEVTGWDVAAAGVVVVGGFATGRIVKSLISRYLGKLQALREYAPGLVGRLANPSSSSWRAIRGGPRSRSALPTAPISPTRCTSCGWRLKALRRFGRTRPRSFNVYEFADSAITLRFLYWRDPRIADERNTRSDVALAIEGALADAGIEIAFPQRTLWWGSSARAATAS